jgi:hypothetical protein
VSDLILPDSVKPQAQKQPDPGDFNPMLVYQDENYMVLRVRPIPSMSEKLQIPFHLTQIGYLGITAKEFVPRVGKDNFIRSLKTLKRAFQHHLDEQRAIAEQIKPGEKPLSEVMKEQGIE